MLFAITTSAHAVEWVNCNADTFCGAGVWDYTGTVDIVSDPSSPDTTSNVWRFTFPRGITSSDIAMVYFGFPSSVTEVWMQYYFKYSSGFVFHDVATKQIYYYTTGFGSTNNSNFMLALNSEKRLNITPQGSDFANYPPNINTTTGYTDVTGTWHKVKTYFKFNTGSNWDGKYKIWVDDVLVSDYSNVMFDSRYLGWGGMGVRPIWGGMSSQEVPATQYMYVDRFYLGSTDPGGGPVPAGKSPMPPTTLKIE